MTRSRYAQRRKRQRPQADSRQDLAVIRESLSPEALISDEVALETSDDSSGSSVYVTARTSPEQLGTAFDVSKVLPDSLPVSCVLANPADLPTEIAELMTGRLPDRPLSRAELSLIIVHPESRDNPRFMVILQMIHWLRRNSLQNLETLYMISRLVLTYEEEFAVPLSIKTLSEMGVALYNAAVPWIRPWTEAQESELHNIAVPIVMTFLEPSRLPTILARPLQPLDFRPLPSISSLLADLLMESRSESAEDDQPGPSRPPRKRKGKAERGPAPGLPTADGIRRKVTLSKEQAAEFLARARTFGLV